MEYIKETRFKEIKVNGVSIKVYTDGSIEKPNKRGNSFIRTYGSVGRKVMVTCIGGKCYPIRRLVAEAYLPGWDSGLFVHNKNGDPANNRPENLVIDTSRVRRGKIFSDYHGVYWHKASISWFARVTISKTETKTEHHPKEEYAARAYDRLVKKHNLDKPLNFPDSSASDISTDPLS